MTPEEIRILKAIDNGFITKKKMKEELEKLIENEINQDKRPVNSELLEACQSLLFRLNHHRYVSNKEESMKTVKKRLIMKDKRQRLCRNMLKTAAVFVFIMGGTLIVDAFLFDGRLTSYSTEDEQQYVVEGNVVEGQFTPIVLADGSAEADAENFIEMKKVKNLLGYIPACPKWLPEGWKPLEYYASVSPFATVFKIQYTTNINETNFIKYGETRYTDIEVALLAFEQSQNGNSYNWNNTNVYIATNIDEPIATWIKDNVCYSLSGPLTIEEIKKIFNSI